MYTSIHVSPNGSLMWIYTLFSAWNWKLKLSMLSVCLFVIVCWAMNNKWKKSLLRNHWICNWSYPDDINRFLPGYRPVPIGVVKIKWPIELVVHWPFRRYAHCGEEFFETDLSVPIRIVGLEKNSLLCSSVCVCGFFFVCVCGFFFVCVCVFFYLFFYLFYLFIFYRRKSETSWEGLHAGQKRTIYNKNTGILFKRSKHIKPILSLLSEWPISTTTALENREETQISAWCILSASSSQLSCVR